MDQNLRLAKERFVEALSSQSAFWGLGKITGQLYAALYLSENPLSLSELAESLGVTKGNVSVAIRSLENLGMVRRSIKPGDRRVFFKAENDFWLIGRRILERRQKPEFDMSFQMLEQSLASAEQAVPTPETEFTQKRLKEIRQFYRDLDQLTGLMLRIDPAKLSAVLNKLSGPKKS